MAYSSYFWACVSSCISHLDLLHAYLEGWSWSADLSCSWVPAKLLTQCLCLAGWGKEPEEPKQDKTQGLRQSFENEGNRWAKSDRKAITYNFLHTNWISASLWATATSTALWFLFLRCISYNMKYPSGQFWSAVLAGLCQHDFAYPKPNHCQERAE